jgi:ribosomal protein L12E/L44/L45/RPP1/RPP2
MEIKIAAEDMYEVLVTAGIEANDAKAIIFDLLLAADGKFKPARTVQQYAPVAQTPVAPPARTKVVAPPAPAPEEEEEAPTEEADAPQQRSKIRRRLVNFSGFGGPAEPLR